MRRSPFWPVAALSTSTWLVAVVLFYRGLTLPADPVHLVPVIGLFYLPSLLIGICAGHPGTLEQWSRGRLWAACLLGSLGFVPWALLTFPLLPLTFGSILMPIALLVWGWHHQRRSRLAPAATVPAMTGAAA
jgi:hypothetical protein